MVQDSFPTKPEAKWMLAIITAILSCVVCACVMFGVNTAYLYYLTGGNMPAGYEAGSNLGAELAQSNPLYLLTSLSVFCLPPAIMLPTALLAYFVVDRYQKRKLEASQQMPGPATELINKG